MKLHSCNSPHVSAALQTAPEEVLVVPDTRGVLYIISQEIKVFLEDVAEIVPSLVAVYLH